MVTSDHNPLDIELKKVEFDYAHNGTVGLESAFGALNSVLPTKTVIKLLTKGKERFGIEDNIISVGNKVSMTLFNPDVSYEFSKNDIISKSKNAIFEGHTLKGKAYGIIANKKIIL